jgi:riboflavin synthase
MFTGIIHHLGIFKGYGRGKLELIVEAPSEFPNLPPGESVAVDGVCLSLTRAEERRLAFDLSGETVGKTTLGALKTGARLNLEPPLTLQSLLSGHLLAGHVDGRGRILRLVERKPGKRLVISLPRELRPYLVPKGSIAINGVSLTVAAIGPKSFEVELVPITIGKSNLADLKRGQEVNLECDILGKYVYNWVSQGRRQG